MNAVNWGTNVTKCFYWVYLTCTSWHSDNIVSIRTHYRLDCLGFESRQKQDFSLLQNVHTFSGVHPASYSTGTGFLFLVYVAWAQSCHSLLSSIAVKNYWRCTSISPVCFHGWTGNTLHYFYKKLPLTVTNHIFPRLQVDKFCTVYTMHCVAVITIQNQQNALTYLLHGAESFLRS